MRMVEEEHGPKERRKLWFKLMGLCVKTVLPIQPTLEAECNGVFPRDGSGGQMGWRCFEILGIDVMLDAKRKPYLIEINHLPSFTTDSPLDLDIKRRLVEQTLELTCGSVGAKDAKLYGELAAARRESVGGPPGNSPQAASAGGGGGGHRPPEAECILDAPVYKDFDRAYPPPPEAAKLGAQCQAIHARVQELFNPVHAARRREASREPAGAAQRPPLLPHRGSAAAVAGGGAASGVGAPCAGAAGSSRRSRSPACSPGAASSPTAPPPQRPVPVPAAKEGGGAPTLVGATGLPAAKRSLSAPGPPGRCSLPLLPRAAGAATGATTPRSSRPSPHISTVGGSGGTVAGRGRSQPPRGDGGTTTVAASQQRPTLLRKASSSVERVQFVALKPVQLML